MQAIILAAGMGKRLKKLTKDNTKCMIKVNGVTLIERILHQLDCRNLSRIVIVEGYEGKKLINYIESLSIHTPIEYIDNPIYDKTNNIYSLALAKDYLCKEDTLLLESDLIFEDSLLDILIDDPRESLALVDKYESWMDGTCVVLEDDDSITDFVPGNKFQYEDMFKYYKTVNIYKFSRHFSETHYVPFLEAYSKALGNNEYYEQVLRVITMLDEPEIRAKRLNGEMWYEIDDIQDLDIAESLFTSDEDRAQRISLRYGGYWRYPKVINFCDPGNPYFPPKRMIDELKANLERVISAYPSGAEVNSLLAAKNIGVDTENVAIANGVEELIKSILSIQPTEDSIGIVRPINEEYIQRLKGLNTEEYWCSTNDSLVAEDIKVRFMNTNIKLLILSNPNTHTGVYIEKNEICSILDWAEAEKIRVLLDESYIDFTSAEKASIIESDLYKKYTKLIVLRNLSASQGMFGLRIGCAISADAEEIGKIRKDLTIWNINSVAEFYLQIFEKYKKAFASSLRATRNARNKLVADIECIDGICPIPSETNFVTCKIISDKYNSENLISELLKHNILVKNVSKRIMGQNDCIRIAVRKEDENKHLVDIMADIINSKFGNSRIADAKCNIDNGRTKKFFDERADKKLPHRYNYVIYQDLNPSLALERDRYEKERFLPHMNVQSCSDVLDIGCGVGRWADEFVKHLVKGHYIGVDYSEGLLEIAKSQFSNKENFSFFQGSFQEIKNVLKNNNLPCESGYDIILINGILMYINDDDIDDCIITASGLIKSGGCIYIKESVGINKRFTLKDFYSNELTHNYNAIYRSITEYQDLFDSVFGSDQFECSDKGYTWDSTQENRTETSSYFWIYKKTGAEDV